MLSQIGFETNTDKTKILNLEKQHLKIEEQMMSMNNLPLSQDAIRKV